MPEFLELVSPDEALQLWINHFSSMGIQAEWLQTTRACNRVSAVDVRSPEPSPAFSRSTMDGYAVRAADTFGASETLPVYLSMIGEVPMGRAPEFKLKPGQAALIYTGGMIPEGADAVVMLEQTQNVNANEVEIYRAVATGENMIKQGEDVAEGDIILPAGKRMRPVEIGGLLALGVTRVQVVRRPRLAVLSSGDEVISPDEKPVPGQVRDINSYSLAALIENAGGLAVLYGIFPDNAEDLREVVERAWRECDAVIITAGSSASTRDLTANVVNNLGKPGVLVHGINIRPGKPTILAVCDGKPIVGLPGNPVSALVIAGLFVIPLVEHLLGLSLNHPVATVMARLTSNIPSQAGRVDYIPVRLNVSAETAQAEPIFFKSSLIFGLIRADGLIKIPASATGLSAGELVDVFLLQV